MEEKSEFAYVENPPYTPDEVIAMAMEDEQIDEDPQARAMAVMGVVFLLGM
jgi:hypothetical protein